MLLSGGLDSTVLLAHEIDAGEKPLCVSFSYGQRHAREIDAALSLAGHYGAKHQVLHLPPAALRGSSLTGGGDVPRAHYEDPAQKATVVPNRNAAMLSVAASLAVTRGADRVLFAAHAGDAAIYPDCRRDFIVALDAALRLGCGVGVESPFLGMTKRDIVARGRELKVPFEMTWTCYVGGDAPCGFCGSCVERTEAGA